MLDDAPYGIDRNDGKYVPAYVQAPFPITQHNKSQAREQDVGEEEHKDFFDIKHRAIAPLSDAARVLALGEGILHTKNTADRFTALAEIDAPNRELFENCSYAFKALLKFRTRRGIAQNDSGRFINLEALTKSERLKLKRCFKPLRDVQEVLRVRYQTQNI